MEFGKRLLVLLQCNLIVAALTGLRSTLSTRVKYGGITTISPPSIMRVLFNNREVRLSRIEAKSFYKRIKRALPRDSFTNRTAVRIKSFLKRKDDRIFLTVQSLTSAVFLAAKGIVNDEAVNHLRWYTTQMMLLEGTDYFTERYKEVVNYIQNEIFENEIGYPKLTDKASQVLLEKLLSCSPRFKIERDLVPNEDELWWVSHICQTRFLPLPSFESVRGKTADYIRGLVEIRPEPEGDAMHAGLILSEEVKHRLSITKSKLIEETHLSLSNGSCWEAPRSQGGKWHLIMPNQEFIEFLSKPIWDNFSHQGDVYVDGFGNTVAKDTDAYMETYRIAYLEEPITADLGEYYSPKETLPEVLSHGFDSRLGQLLHAYSRIKYEQFIKDGRTLKSKLLIISEPGGKIRPLTSGETWAYLYMVPAMHILKQSIEILPGARVGLNESDNLWRFGTSYENHFGSKETEEIPEFISSSDLTSATDRAMHETSYRLMSGLIEGLFGDKLGISEYLNSAVRLCCSPREVHVKISRRQQSKFRDLGLRIEDSGRRNFSFTTRQGVMMGDPITKVILTASSIASYYCVTAGQYTLKETSFPKYLDYIRSKTVRVRGQIRRFGRGVLAFACAGDDHTMVGPLHMCLAAPKFLESMGFEISWEKYRISKRYVHYCQDFGLHPRYKRSIKFDNVKLRLLNQFQKQGSMNQFEHPDPLIGKMKELERFMNHFPEGEDKQFLKEVIPFMVRAGFPSFFEKKLAESPLSYVPTQLGGLGIPSIFEVQGEPKVINFMRSQYLLRYMPDQIPIEERVRPVNNWHRGQKLAQDVINFLGQDLEVNDFKEVWEGVSNTLDQKFLTKSSAKRINREIFRSYIDISRPQPLVGTKEDTYAQVATGRAELELVKRKRRTSHLIRQNQREANAVKDYAHNLSDIIDYNILARNYPRHGLWVAREEILNILGLASSSPSLSIPLEYFGGSAGLISLKLLEGKDESLSESYSDI